MTQIPLHAHWPIPPDLQGLRVDQYLQRKIGRISRSRAQAIIRAYDFLLDGARVKVAQRVKQGQIATLIRMPPDDPDDIAQVVVKVIFENSKILVLNKPAGLSMHPSANCLYKTVTYWLRKNRLGQKINPCHRIDKETSGLVLCAKDRQTESQIKKLFMTGQVKKTYLAVVSGKVRSQSINTPLALQKSRGLVRIKMIADSMGKKALTKVRPVMYDEERDRSLAMCKPLTGRQHQIRAHLAQVGHAIVGDKLYSHGEQFFDDYCRRRPHIELELSHPRHALHAYSLKFYLDGLRHAYFCPLPPDFSQLIKY